MFFENIGFQSPWFLLLLLVLPFVWWLSIKSYSGLSGFRLGLSLLLRTALVLIIVCALADVQSRNITKKVTVFYLLDQSDSIPVAKRQAMMDYVQKAVLKHRKSDRGDRAGVIAFGGNSVVEIPANNSDIQTVGYVESVGLTRSSTNLETALRMAAASFPADSAKRVVIVSDGNENVGDSLSVAEQLLSDGVGIDVLPVGLKWSQDVAVTQISSPANVRKGEAFTIRVTVVNHRPTLDPESAKTIKGRLIVKKAVAQFGKNGSSELVAESEVELKPGKNVFEIPQKSSESALINLQASFIPNDGEPDTIRQNNTASAFTNVQGKGRCLLIEDATSVGEFEGLVSVLRRNGVIVDVINSNELFSSLNELIPYDLVILANVPRTGGDESQTFSFSDRQLQMLVDNVEQLGSGLLVIGGDRSLGVGGWNDSILEKALPVELEIKNEKVAVSGALVLLMHACEAANGNHWQKVIAKEAIKVLSPIDYCGLVQWGMNGDNWLWKLPRGISKVTPKNKRIMLAMLGRMNALDMPSFDSSLRLVIKEFPNVNAASKHMIIISDGDPTAPTPRLLQKFIKNKIAISTVAVGAHGTTGHKTLRSIASQTGGKYYVVKDNRALPRIFRLEARKVTKPLIFESKEGLGIQRTPQAEFSEMTRRIDTSKLPPFEGYVLTTKRENGSAQQLLVASKPDDGGENSTILSTWQYGLGRSTVFCTDAGRRWTKQWIDSPEFENLWVQIVRQTMRSVTKKGNFQMTMKKEGGQVKVMLAARDEGGSAINDLPITGTIVTPEGSKTVEFEQTASGRYEAIAETSETGDYVLSVFPGSGYKRLTAGLNVSSTTEFQQRETNNALLEQIAAMKPDGGKVGRVITDELEAKEYSSSLGVDTFLNNLRRAVHLTSIWPLFVVLAGVLLFSDVFARRVALDLEPVGRFFKFVYQSISGNRQEVEVSSMERLKARKESVEKQRDGDGRRFQFDPDSVPNQGPILDDEDRVVDDPRRKRVGGSAGVSISAEKEEAGYTQRLLDAKRRAKHRSDEDGDQKNS